LQQESWQLELLISGGAIFAILEMIKYLDRFNPFVHDAMGDDPSFVTGILVFGVTFIRMGMYIFLINLIIHVLVRSLWIGALGLRYVSGDIDYEQLNYSDNFTRYFRKKIGSFDNYIEKLEDFSSVLFSYTFLLFFILISFLFTGITFSGLLIILGGMLPKGDGNGHILGTIISFSFFIGGMLVAFDFITLGLLKRIENKYFAAFYLPIYRFFSAVTLSFLWRPMLLNFLDQKYTRRLFILALPYLFMLLMFAESSYVIQGFYPNFQNTSNLEYPSIVNEFSFNINYYDEERNTLEEYAYDRNIELLSIPSKKIEGHLGEIFVKGNKGDKLLINHLDSTLTPFEEEGLISTFFSGFQVGFNDAGKDIERRNQIDKLRDSITNKQLFRHLRDSILHESDLDKKAAFRQKTAKVKSILKSSILVSIDDRKVNPTDISCDFYIHPNAKSKGLLCFFPLDSLTIGRHYFKIGKVLGEKESNRSKEIYLDTIYHTIPFIYTGQ